jgi:hypothetical protein
MNRSEHERARGLVLMQGLEEVSADESAWLAAHLGQCGECAEFAEALQLTAQALRSTPVQSGTLLVSATQARVRARAAELQDQQNRYFLIGISFCLGLLWSAGSLFLGWRLSGWLGERFHVAAWMVGAGMVLFWLLPAAAMTLVLVFHRRPTLGPDSTLWMGVGTEGDWR